MLKSNGMLEKKTAVPFSRNTEVKFYHRLNASLNGFVPRVEICKGKDGSFLKAGRELIERWKQYFDVNPNGAECRTHMAMQKTTATSVSRE